MTVFWLFVSQCMHTICSEIFPLFRFSMLFFVFIFRLFIRFVVLPFCAFSILFEFLSYLFFLFFVWRKHFNGLRFDTKMRHTLTQFPIHNLSFSSLMHTMWQMLTVSHCCVFLIQCGCCIRYTWYIQYTKFMHTKPNAKQWVFGEMVASHSFPFFRYFVLA